MIFFSRRKNEKYLRASQKSLDERIDKATEATRRVNKLLRDNGITLELRKAMGGK
jgi:hypothetical protein